jgi:hypothetical protein
MVSAFVLLIWLSFCGYKFLVAKEGPRIEASAEYHAFVVPPFLSFSLTETEKMKELDIIKDFLPKLKESTAEIDILDYTYNNYPKAYSDFLRKYHTLFIFDLKNPSPVPITEIFLEMPFKGKCMISKKGESSEFKDFNKEIDLGDILSGYDATVYVWTEEALTNYQDYLGENIKLKTKQGLINIDFPIRTTGLLAWNLRNDNYPLIFAIAGFFVFLLIIIIIFYNMGAAQGGNQEETEKKKKSGGKTQVVA